ncbi:MAG: DUF362 domain-containing protein [Paludibacter sp.]|nr:DUF362 domain-containing protein [Paludibacter sp.]
MKHILKKIVPLLIRIKKSKLLKKIAFISLGLSSTIWFIVRVIPKPSRAAYPCMRASAPIMSAFVLYLISLFGGVTAWMKAKTFIKNRKYGYATLFTLIALTFTVIITVQNSDRLYSQVISILNPPKMMTAKNEPIGVAKGIFPGRVAWVHNPGVSNWDGKTGFWFEDRWNSQGKANQMVIDALTALTGEKDVKNAWKKLFISFNKSKNKGNHGYANSEKIAIKINQNNTYSHENSPEINASPQLIYSLLKSLINDGGVPQNKITVFDASRFITDFLFDKCHADFPNVIFVDNVGGNGRTKSKYKLDAIHYSKDNGNLARGLATCAIEADYLINVALLKGHVGQGVTLCAKNWYGVTNINNDWRKNFHNNFGQDSNGGFKYMTFVDYMGHKDLGGKTMLYFIDGLYGSKLVNGLPKPKWNMKPFNGNWPCSLLASQDPVAIDAVGLDFISNEWPDAVDMNYADEYLLEAAKANNPPSGTIYDPSKNGIKLKSLGVLEHWNNATDKQYSRNLGKKTGIELVATK